MGMGPMEMLLVGAMLLVIGGGMLAVLYLLLTRLRMPRLGHATLNCPHCEAETRADLPQCQHCTRDL